MNKATNNNVLVQGLLNLSQIDVLKKKKYKQVYLMEGRPDLLAANHNVSLLKKGGLVATLISDNMAGYLCAHDKIKEIYISAQLVEKDEVLCRIGGLISSILGKSHKIPVNVFLNNCKTEVMAKSKELLSFNGVRVAPRGVSAYVPLVEWVPRKYISSVN